MTQDEIAAIAIGRNEGDRLVNCLKSLKANISFVIYVDSGSTDGSVQAAEQLGASVVALDASQAFTAPRARNTGYTTLRMMRPDIRFVQFIDGDCILEKNWLGAAAAFLAAHSDVAVVCGRRREQYPLASIYNRLCNMEWNTPVGEALSCGGDSLVRVDAFDAVGGFNAQLIGGEESELCLRLREDGWKIWRIDSEMTRHDAAIYRFGQWWRRTTRFGYGMMEVTRLHWHSSATVWKAELARTIFWGCILPVAIALGALIYSAVLFGALVYPIQIARIAIARGPGSSDSWLYALFVTLAKFAEFQGILTFCWRQFRRKSVAWIDYK
jgi:cellulose synthase/poly-beta-1,6-N-acetylglucosamine synthase-like glycosyltransferase